jgi:hypothetical protein
VVTIPDSIDAERARTHGPGCECAECLRASPHYAAAEARWPCPCPVCKRARLRYVKRQIEAAP